MKQLREKLNSNTVTAISLFSGAGGLDIGAIYAGLTDGCGSSFNFTIKLRFA